MSNRWHNPDKSLPNTVGGERSFYTIRVPVEVILSDGTQEIVQFRREPKEKGGVFCGFKGTGDIPAGMPVDGLDYGEHWSEWISYGRTWYTNVSTRTVKKWRYVQPEVINE